MFLMWGQGPYIIGWIGVFITMLALLFSMRLFRPRLTEVETAQ
jgi:hypothetical protein